MNPPPTEPCADCEREVHVDRFHWRVHKTTAWVDVPEGYDGDDSQGTHALGTCCRRSHRYAFVAEPWGAPTPATPADAPDEP